MPNQKDFGPTQKQRPDILTSRRNAKMARSAHVYMRGNTVKFYEWLDTAAGRSLPEGPPIWICGDCHVGNLGPVANLEGRVNIQIRDLDQTVIGNPAHDLIRLGLSLATAARSSDLPGLTTARMIEEMMIGYSAALSDGPRKKRPVREVKAVNRVMEQALRRRWRNLAEDRIENVRPSIPRGDKFWQVTPSEERELEALFSSADVRKLITAMRSRDDHAKIKLLDAAYWVKGCSSLGRLRYAVLVGIAKKRPSKGEICLLDIKEATPAAAPRSRSAHMPRDHANRVVQGAKSLAPNLGERMLAAQLNGKSVVIRELLPQDLKLEIEQLTHIEAVHAARFLATVVGAAHASQMDRPTKLAWRRALQQQHTKTLDAPSWFWTSVVELVASHEAGYLEHCRQFQTLVN
jgi:uncharacterized protein (DUF2252 family)